MNFDHIHIPAISTVSPLIDFIPVAFIVAVGMSKEAYLDYKRWKEDKKLNQKPCKVLKNVTNADDQSDGLVFQDSELQHIKVGDIIKLVDDEYVPADCIVLQS